MNGLAHGGSKPSHQSWSRSGLIGIYVAKLQTNGQASGNNSRSLNLQCTLPTTGFINRQATDCLLVLKVKGLGLQAQRRTSHMP